MRNIKLVLAYDGTHYLGWQKTNTGKSIEGELQTVLEQILQHPIILQAASRTDAGVHANGQVVNFFTEKSIEIKRLAHGINALLPADIRMLSLEEVSEQFHPTLDNKGKEYHYFVCADSVQMPSRRLYSWHYSYTLDFDLMSEGAKKLQGHHDFAAFCNFKKNATYTHYMRTVQSIHIEKLPENRLKFVIIGNQFLYKMVRNIVGTLLYIGQGKILLDDLNHILLEGDRTKAGVTAPAHGLFLAQVLY